jgi:hypothetical protein
MEFMRGATGQYVLPLAFIAGLAGIAFILAIVIREPALAGGEQTYRSSPKSVSTPGE